MFENYFATESGVCALRVERETSPVRGREINKCSCGAKGRTPPIDLDLSAPAARAFSPNALRLLFRLHFSSSAEGSNLGTAFKRDADVLYERQLLLPFNQHKKPHELFCCARGVLMGKDLFAAWVGIFR